MGKEDEDVIRTRVLQLLCHTFVHKIIQILGMGGVGANTFF